MAHIATKPLTLVLLNKNATYVKIKILAIVFLQEKGRVRTSLPHSVGGRNNDPFSFMTENYVKQGFVLARNIPYESPILGQILDLISPAKFNLLHPRFKSYDPWDMANCLL